MRTSWIIAGLSAAGVLVALAAAAQVGAPAAAKEAGAQAEGASTQGTPASEAINQSQGNRPEKDPTQTSTAATPAAGAPSADEAAIRRVVDAFTKAYDAGDAKAIAALFVPDAEIVSEDGTVHQGRDAIETEFADVFKQHPKASIKSDIQSIRFVSPTLAVEVGTSIVTHDPDEPSEHTRYEVVHVKQAGIWQMASARDLPDDEASAQEHLNQLHWLIGDWVDESPDALVRTSYRWSANHHFILSDFTANLNGQIAISGTQRIGWDPLAKTIRSWAFDSEGGFVEGVWSREGNQWINKTTGVTSDGKSASSTNYLTRLRKHRLTWQSRDRFVGGEKTPDLGPITIVRQAPIPGAFKHIEPRK